MHEDEEKQRYQAIDRCLSYCVFTMHDTKEVWKKIRFPKSSRTKVIVAILLLVIVQVIVTWLLRIWG